MTLIFSFVLYCKLCTELFPSFFYMVNLMPAFLSLCTPQIPQFLMSLSFSVPHSLQVFLPCFFFLSACFLQFFTILTVFSLSSSLHLFVLLSCSFYIELSLLVPPFRSWSFSVTDYISLFSSAPLNYQSLFLCSTLFKSCLPQFLSLSVCFP